MKNREMVENNMGGKNNNNDNCIYATSGLVWSIIVRQMFEYLFTTGQKRKKTQNR